MKVDPASKLYDHADFALKLRDSPWRQRG